MILRRVKRPVRIRIISPAESWPHQGCILGVSEVTTERVHAVELALALQQAWGATARRGNLSPARGQRTPFYRSEERFARLGVSEPHQLAKKPEGPPIHRSLDARQTPSLVAVTALEGQNNSRRLTEGY